MSHHPSCHELNTSHFLKRAHYVLFLCMAVVSTRLVFFFLVFAGGGGWGCFFLLLSFNEPLDAEGGRAAQVSLSSARSPTSPPFATKMTHFICRRRRRGPGVHVQSGGPNMPSRRDFLSPFAALPIAGIRLHIFFFFSWTLNEWLWSLAGKEKTKFWPEFTKCPLTCLLKESAAVPQHPSWIEKACGIFFFKL